MSLSFKLAQDSATSRREAISQTAFSCFGFEILLANLTVGTAAHRPRVSEMIGAMIAMLAAIAFGAPGGRGRYGATAGVAAVAAAACLLCRHKGL